MPSSIINSDDGVVSGTSGLKSVGGDDGVLVFQSKGTETARINTDKQIVAAAGTNSLPALTTTGDLNTGIFFPAADTIAFTEGGVEAMRIDSSGRVGIGTSSPSSTNSGLDISSGGLSLIVGANLNSNARTNSTDKYSRIGSYHYTNAEEPVALLTSLSDSTNNFLTVGGGTNALNAATTIQFYTAANNTTTTGTERARITSDGYFRMAGGGIQFNGDTAAANALNDYEEGTFTPRASDSSDNTSTAGAGEYVKIGSLVYIMLNINDISSFPQLAGTFEIKGLPFTADASFNQPMTVMFNSININDSAKYVVALTKTNAARLAFNEVFDNATMESIASVDIADDVTDIWVSGCYKVA
jgi:hypothetical protein